MTPAELNTYARATAQRLRDEQKIAQGNIYSLAALIRTMVWSKNPPSFEQSFPKAAQQKMTDDQMFAMVKGLNARFGGKEAG